MKQQIFYYYRNTKIQVKPELTKTVYSFKLGERDVFFVEVPLNDHYETRQVVNSYIDRLSLN